MNDFVSIWFTSKQQCLWCSTLNCSHVNKTVLFRSFAQRQVSPELQTFIKQARGHDPQSSDMSYNSDCANGIVGTVESNFMSYMEAT